MADDAPPPRRTYRPLADDADCGHSACKTYVTITWHDGTSERQRCSAVAVREGVLSMAESHAGNQHEARCVPLTSIREYWIERYG